MTREWHILNLGVGVQSSTVYLMACAGEVVEFDFSIFADPGDEPQDVYLHLEWLRKVGTIPIMVRSRGKLGDDLKLGRVHVGVDSAHHAHYRHRSASIPAFTSAKDGGKVEGMIKRQCSKEYKIEVIERTIRRDIVGLKPRQRMPKDVLIHQYFGISLDEAGRAVRIEEAARKHKWLRVHFPLLEKNMTRTDCLNWLSGRVPHQVPKSACVFCPYHSDAEWLTIKKNPEDWARAVEIDEALRANDHFMGKQMEQKLYLHRSCKPLVQIEFNPKPSSREFQTNINFNQECMGVCGV